MVPEQVATPQFRTESAEEEHELTAHADHSAEMMARLRHPFDPTPLSAALEDFSGI
jgi:hypothetical protein